MQVTQAAESLRKEETGCKAATWVEYDSYEAGAF